MPKSTRTILALFSAVVGILWAFPHFWYGKGQPAGEDYAWFAEQSEITGWEFERVPIGKAAEAVLVADAIVNGEFTGGDGRNIQVYAAKRYLEKENEVGLFSHTPDRCWTATGWKIEPTEPDFVELSVHSLPMRFERRIFAMGTQRRLVYFGALVGGKALPYRIDQYFAAGLNRRDSSGGDTGGTWQRLMQPRLWSWAWESFVHRTPLAGPQQFVRISTSIQENDIARSDQLLVQFLPRWLRPTPYMSEFAAWQAMTLDEKTKRKGAVKEAGAEPATR